MIFKEGNEISIKGNISSYDISNVVESAIEFVFRVKDDGTAVYTPYYLQDGIEVAIIVYLLNGVEIEDTDNDILGEAKSNEDVIAVMNDFRKTSLYKDIRQYIVDILEFRKNDYIFNASDFRKRMIQALDVERKLNESALKLAEQQYRLNEQSEEILNLMSPEEVAAMNKKIASGEFSVDDIANVAIKKYMETDKHDANLKSVIDDKNEKITELQSIIDAHKKKED